MATDQEHPLGELETARYRADRDALHAMYREGGLALLTRWIRRILGEAPHPDIRRVDLVDEHTIVLTTFSGTVATVYIDHADACSWCGGSAVAQVPKLHRPPCEGCLGTGLAGRQRGTVAAPTGRAADEVSDERGPSRAGPA